MIDLDIKFPPLSSLLLGSNPRSEGGGSSGYGDEKESNEIRR